VLARFGGPFLLEREAFGHVSCDASECMAGASFRSVD
jgi:hypothetical protein